MQYTITFQTFNLMPMKIPRMPQKQFSKMHFTNAGTPTEFIFDNNEKLYEYLIDISGAIK